MQALRLVREIENGKLTIALPKPFRKGKMEIIIMPLEEIETTQDSDFDPDRFRGIWKHMNVDAEKMCREMREEWTV